MTRKICPTTPATSLLMVSYCTSKLQYSYKGNPQQHSLSELPPGTRQPPPVTGQDSVLHGVREFLPPGVAHVAHPRRHAAGLESFTSVHKAKCHGLRVAMSTDACMCV